MCPTKSVHNVVPEEASSGRKHSVTHMRVFGCVAYAHVSDELRKKLDSKGEKCIFFGYNDESKAYKLYNSSIKKVIINRDVQFIEEESWDGSLEMTFNVKAYIPHENKEELITTSNSSIVTPSTPIQVQQSRHQAAPSTNNRTVSHSQASASASTPQSATPSDMSSPFSASTRRPKFINLNEIYEQHEVDSSDGLNSLFALFCHVHDPIHFEDVVKEEKWVAIMGGEIEEIERNDTWELVSLPKGKHVIVLKWVYNTKSNIEGKIERHKARLVVKGYK